jgi:hypothetical protein
MTSKILTINADGSALEIRAVSGSEQPVVATIRTHAEMLHNMNSIDFVSSSIDFPEEFTSDENILSLCRAIRS